MPRNPKMQIFLRVLNFDDFTKTSSCTSRVAPSQCRCDYHFHLSLVLGAEFWQLARYRYQCIWSIQERVLWVVNSSALPWWCHTRPPCWRPFFRCALLEKPQNPQWSRNCLGGVVMLEGSAFKPPIIVPVESNTLESKCKTIRGSLSQFLYSQSV